MNRARFPLPIFDQLRSLCAPLSRDKGMERVCHSQLLLGLYGGLTTSILFRFPLVVPICEY